MILQGQSRCRNGNDDFSYPQTADLWYVKILDSINDGILVIDECAIVRYVNAEYTRITGVSSSQIIGRYLTDVRPGAMLPSVVKTGRSLSGVYRREGEIEYVVDMAPIVVGGKTVGGVSVVKDITEVQKLSEEVKRYHKNTERLKNMVDRMYRAKYSFADVLGSSAAMGKTVETARRIAHGHADVLITGESGTGKEVFAQAIHNESARAEGPFVAINCATITLPLIESELFGYEDGSFTGARKGGKLGLFEIAGGGTIFLDEITELSLEMQAKLLRVLQERTVRRIGNANEIAIDIRVMAASNKDICSLVKENAFRDDLYYRLCVLNLNLPPLRERGQDVWLLAENFVVAYAQKVGHHFHLSNEVRETLLRYHWPGNVRELRNVIEYAVNMCDNGVITVLHLPEWLKAAAGDKEPASRPLVDRVHSFERRIIKDMLDHYGADMEAKRKIAQELGISLATLYNKMKEINLHG